MIDWEFFKNKGNFTKPPNSNLVAITRGTKVRDNIRAIEFNGVDTCYSLVEDLNNNVITERPLTFFLLVKFTGVFQSGYIINKNYNSLATTQYSIRATTVGGNSVVFCANGSDKITLPNIVTNKWYFITLDYDGALIRSSINFANGPSINFSDNFTNRQFFRLGARSNSTDGNTNTIFFKGLLALVGISNCKKEDVEVWAKNFMTKKRIKF